VDRTEIDRRRRPPGASPGRAGLSQEGRVGCRRCVGFYETCGGTFKLMSTEACRCSRLAARGSGSGQRAASSEQRV